MPNLLATISDATNLLLNGVQAAAVPWLRVDRSILGSYWNPKALEHGYETEWAAFSSFDVDAAETAARALIPLSSVGPSPQDSGPIDFPSDYPIRAGERWFFINGICTDRRLAFLNARLISKMFERPLTILYNATDGMCLDLLESAFGKGFHGMTESASRNLKPFAEAICDDNVQRVVLVAHSQGTILAAMMLLWLHELLASTARLPGATLEGRVSPELKTAKALAGTGSYRPATARGVSPQLRRVLPAHVGKLELYCFANCATEMGPITALGAQGRHAPWIESYGNDHDIVARLGVLAPPYGIGSARILGDRYRRVGAWGHLLNAHYLIPLLNDDAAKAPSRKKLVPIGQNLNPKPRLLGYLGGSTPPPY